MHGTEESSFVLPPLFDCDVTSAATTVDSLCYANNDHAFTDAFVSLPHVPDEVLDSHISDEKFHSNSTDLFSSSTFIFASSAADVSHTTANADTMTSNTPNNNTTTMTLDARTNEFNTTMPNNMSNDNYNFPNDFHTYSWEEQRQWRIARNKRMENDLFQRNAPAMGITLSDPPTLKHQRKKSSSTIGKVTRQKSARKIIAPDRLGVIVDPGSNEVTMTNDTENVDDLVDMMVDDLPMPIDFMHDTISFRPMYPTPYTTQYSIQCRKTSSSRSFLLKTDLPKILVDFLQPNILMGSFHTYKHVSPYWSHNVMKGWGAQIKVDGKLTRVGTFDDEFVAAIAVTAALMDASLLTEPCKAKSWIEDMCKESFNSELLIWINRMASESDDSLDCAANILTSLY